MCIVNSFKHTLYAMFHLCLCVLNCRKSINLSEEYLTAPNLKTKLKQFFFRVLVLLFCHWACILKKVELLTATSSCVLLSYFLFLMLLFQSQRRNKKLSGIIFKYFFINSTLFISQSAAFSRPKSIKRTVT